MLRRIKRMLGISSRGSYCPHDEVAPADGSVVSTSSRKSTKSTKSEKKSKKEKKMSQLAVEPPKVELLEESFVDDGASAAITITTSSDPSVIVAVANSHEIMIGGEDSIVVSELSTTTRNTVSTDSLPYREPSDRSQESSRLSNAALSVEDAELSDGASVRSLAGSGATNTQTVDGNKDQMSNQTSSVESLYSSENVEEDNTFENNMEYGHEMAVDCDLPRPPLVHSEESSSPVSSPETPNLLGDEDKKDDEPGTSDETPEAVEDEEEDADDFRKDDEMQRRWKELNDDLCGILKKPAPFNVSTSRIPPMASLDEHPVDDSIVFSNEEFDEKNNSVTRILNESHEATMKSPEQKHLRSYGY